MCGPMKLLTNAALIAMMSNRPRPIGESWGMANTFLLGLINATYMHDLKSLVYNHKE